VALRHHKEMIESHGTVLHYQQVEQDRQTNLLHVQKYETDRQETLRKLESLENAAREMKYQKTLEWIYGASSTEDHENCRSTRADYPGSGDWILEHEDVYNWKDVETPVNSLLWLNAIPGAGTFFI
jgi:hypothetical protein